VTAADVHAERVGTGLASADRTGYHRSVAGVSPDDLAVVRAAIASALGDQRLSSSSAIALRSALRLIDAVAAYESPPLHAEALTVAREALASYAAAVGRQIS
jgi:hypothetical protein